MGRYVVGVDLGGTNLRCAVLDDKHNVLARSDSDTRASEGYVAIIDRLAKGVLEAVAAAGLKPADILGAGVGCPGPVDAPSGIVATAPNLKWNNVPLVAMMEERTGIKTILENDANAAGWGEFWCGAGQGCRNMVLMTLGTGVGGAIIIDGKLVTGADWGAGEIGHVVIADGGRKCGCGGRGCLEAYASATSTVARFLEALDYGWQSKLSAMPRGSITCAEIFSAAQAGDNLASHIVAETGRYLGLMAANLANLLNPERCVFAGGMIKAGPVLFDAIKAELHNHAFPALARRLEILPAQLGGDAGIIGAAGCVLERIG